MRGARGRAEIIRFEGVEGFDVYNITAPFIWLGQTLLFGRVEARATEHSKLVLFSLGPNGTWSPSDLMPPFDSLQDPCFTEVDGDIVLGGVRFPVDLADGGTGWRMEFHRLTGPGRLEHLFSGPDKMKDIRLKQLPGGSVAVFTRPQGRVGGRGRIGFTVVPRLSAVTAEVIEAADLLPPQHSAEEWSGANEVHLLENGLLGVLGHLARFDHNNHRQYFAVAFSVCPATRRAGSLQLIAERQDFPEGPIKRPDLVDVIFSGGLVRGRNGSAELYVGLSDAAAARIEIPDPFTAMESPTPQRWNGKAQLESAAVE
jgi:hypothetical protein